MFDRDIRIDSVSEPLHRKIFIAELPVERFLSTVLPGHSRINMCGIYVRCREPLQDRSGHKLRAVVRSQIIRAAMNTHQLAEHFDYPSRANAAGYIDGQALMRKLVEHRQTLQLLLVGATIEHKVISPDVTPRCGRQRAADDRSIRAAAAFLQALAADADATGDEPGRCSSRGRGAP